MYWYLNKTTKEAVIFTSMKALADITGLNYDTVSYHFTKKKRKQYETEEHRIVKTKPVSSKRN